MTLDRSTHPAPVTADAVLTKATVRAAGHLGLSQQALSKVLHVSPATVSRWFGGQSVIGAGSAEGHLARLFVRVFRSLDALVGGNPQKARAWFVAHNHHLGAPPAERIGSIEGLVHVAEYLDAVRGTL
jgi:transcriptional regulator with XRE-family HTH domain